ncbi:LysE family translocator [Pseudomonas sp. PDM16]|uniref:LysE family translocator n=1 Tax=Pseudomonas sp. PDM16 TaxID=2769292 RepID=UPI001CE19EC2|nr:LysE family transporter [Pseudomonas sp. PDM16]
MTLMDAVLFAPIAALISLGPGPNNFCALNNGINYGFRAALLATFGRLTAYAIFLFVSAVGLGAMLLASETAFTIIKWVGALYLVYLGIKTWRSTEFSGLKVDEGELRPQDSAKAPIGKLMLNEFLVGISNPKAILLFAAIFPQFIKPGEPAAEQFLYLGSTYLLAELLVGSTAYALFGMQIRRLVRSSKGVSRLNKSTGAFFVGAGGLMLGVNNH